MDQNIKQITLFIQSILKKANKIKLVIAVSGGIDSAVALTLATLATGKESIYPLLLPYADQDITDSLDICRFNLIPADNIQIINIKESVDQICHSDLAISQDQNPYSLTDSELDLRSCQNDAGVKVRLGNIGASPHDHYF